MPNLHDIERRINSVNSTKKITRTMEMVAAAKIRFASERVEKATPYSDSMAEMLADVATRVGGAENALLKKHDEVKNVLLVVMVSDRGLAGGFNSNILREAEHLMKAKAAEGAQCHVVACGKKAIGYFTYRNVTPVLEFAGLSADPTVEEAMTIAQYAISGYTEGALDEVVLLYNHPKNAAEQVMRTEMLLPVDTSALAQDGEGATSGDVDFEPSAEAVLDSLLPAYVQTMVYHALIDSAAGEQGARRNAMKAATDNANEMAETLTRMYNRVRQGAITTEINEIVGGAAALED
ncbi:MAG TPA: ATP synthase F1 subunit gamma [Candidatus Aveggerthella excrementigallinarum]|nr:ATP synthase F1 subunit gamma [Candidatus Aveggerthella excrementigallinarum]